MLLSLPEVQEDAPALFTGRTQQGCWGPSASLQGLAPGFGFDGAPLDFCVPLVLGCSLPCDLKSLMDLGKAIHFQLAQPLPVTRPSLARSPHYSLPSPVKTAKTPMTMLTAPLSELLPPECSVRLLTGFGDATRFSPARHGLPSPQSSLHNFIPW